MAYSFTRCLSLLISCGITVMSFESRNNSVVSGGRPAGKSFNPLFEQRIDLSWHEQPIGQ